jgi:hypothetical protein
MTTADQGKEDRQDSQSPTRQLARRLIEARRSERTEGDTPARAAARASDRLYRELSRWVGVDGCHALFSRALTDARADFPALGQIKIRARLQPHIDGTAETIMARGDPATAEALESMLVRLAELLGRLIGDDMATKLVERSLAGSERDDNDSDASREEA